MRLMLRPAAVAVAVATFGNGGDPEDHRALFMDDFGGVPGVPRADIAGLAARLRWRAGSL